MQTIHKSVKTRQNAKARVEPGQASVLLAKGRWYQKEKVSLWPQQVQQTAPISSGNRTESISAAGGSPGFKTILSCIHGSIRGERSTERRDHCHFWTDSVHKCVRDLKVARQGCLQRSTFFTRGKQNGPCLWRGGALPSERRFCACDIDWGN